MLHFELRQDIDQPRRRSFHDVILFNFNVEMASKAVPICLNITQEQLEMPVWHQIQNNGFLDPGDFEIRYASTVDDMSNLSLEDNFSDEENELQENDWSEYEERLEAFFIANDVPDKKKLETENIAEFASKVKRASAKCDFGTHLPRALRDQFVIGVKNQATKKKLLSEDKTFEDCQKIAIADETADREAKCIENENLLATPVNKIYTNKSEPRKRQVLMPQHKQFNCYRCGSSQHGANTCKYIKSICHYCHKPGHLESVCFKKQRDEKQKKIHLVDTQMQEDSNMFEVGDIQNITTHTMYHVHSTSTANDSHENFKVTVGVQVTPITMEIDTGSSVTLITKADFLKTIDTCDTLKTPSVILKGYGGNKIKCIGEKEMKIQKGEQEDVCIMRVVDVDGPSLLRRDIMTKFTLPWKTIFKITRTEADIISQYPKLFEKGLGKLKDTQVSLHKSVPQLSSARVKRWALLLAAYDYDIKHIPGKENCAADFLSRKPGHRKPSEEQVPVQVLLIQEEQIINSKTVKEETAKDTILSKVLKFTKDGWSTQPDESMIPYFRKRLEITVEDDILMWDSRVILPKSLQELLLKDLHAEHQGHPATNGMAERYVGHFKTSMKKMGDKQEDLQVKLDRFFFTNRTTPNASDRSPAELLMNRQPRIRYAALKASQTQQQVKTFEKNLDKNPNFETGQAVFALNFGKGSKWIPGVITKTLSPRNFEVQVGDVIWKRHQDQIRPRHIPLKEPHPQGHGRETGPPRISGTGVSQPPENRQTQPQQVPRNTVRHTAPDRESRETDLTMVTANPETVNPEDNCRDCELEQLDKRNNIETGQSAAVTGYRENQTHLRHSERLRGYQNELAEVALSGHNCIICAPTGSGKTKVSIKIILEHLERVPNAKVAFFAKTIPLVMQQHQTIERHLPKYNVLNLTGKSNDSLHLHILLPGYSVVVLSPTILVNHLRGNRPLLSEGIASFTLLVFDECHHTQKDDSYNDIMHYYLKEKRKGLPRTVLPQIVGLTASIGVGKAANLEAASKNIMKICGNLDIEHLVIVKKNIHELRETVPRPEEYQEELVEDPFTAIRSKIIDIMKQLEDFAELYAKELNDASLLHCVKHECSSKKDPEYCQWVMHLRKAVMELKIEGGAQRTLAFRYLDIITHYLQAYHFSLETLDLAQTEDVMKFLDQSFSSFSPEINPDRTVPEENLYGLYLTVKEVANGQRNFVNPNLKILAAKLRENVVNGKHGARAIVFVRTRVLSEAVASWLCKCGDDDLMRLNARKFTGSQALEDQGGTSVVEQKWVMENFRSGKVRVLIATSAAEEGIDIPECNMVIRYNYTSNEVGKVQTRGRSRTSGGISILLAMPGVIQLEKKNCAQERLMESALHQISEMSSAQFSDKVNAHQRKLFAEWDLNAKIKEKRRSELKNVQFRVLCCGCRKILVHSSELRKIKETHYISISRNLLDHIKIKPEKKQQHIAFLGTAYCKGATEPGKCCDYNIGKLLTHKGCPFVALGCKKLLFLRDNEQQPDPKIKRWKEVGYFIEELTSEQLHEYATEIFRPDCRAAFAN
ncbi:hypothetical protein RRG08_035567 [Elysia crispata]|uniref:RNA helicase n=1 Tax=Elysia crispata TaxID=231223 RepID=A0AAE1B4A4_9GAST|nr:hypothetical protein RRG08_035567 [Elysia crispata]